MTYVTSGSGDHYFFTQGDFANSGGGRIGLFIGNNGNIGVGGTTNPGALLDISGSLYDVPLNIFHSSNSASFRISASNNGFTNIEIGNYNAGASAGSSLRFVNDASTTNNPQATIALCSSTHTFGSNRFIIYNQTGSVELTSTVGNVDINTSNIGTSSTKLRVFNSTGNVGIGSNPSDGGYKLNVNEPGTSGALRVSGSVNIVNGSVTMPNRPAFRVSGSATTGRSATTTLSGSATVVDYNQGSNYNNTTGLFTAPIAGLYHVYLNVRTNTGATQQAIVYKNRVAGVGGTAMMMWEATGSFNGHFGVSSILNLAANDTLQVVVALGTIQFDSNDNWGVAYIG